MDGVGASPPKVPSRIPRRHTLQPRCTAAGPGGSLDAQGLAATVCSTTTTAAPVLPALGTLVKVRCVGRKLA